MANYLAPVQPLLAEKLLQMMEASSLKTSCPLPVDIKPLELPKDEPEGNATTKGRKRVGAKIKEETTQKFEAAKQDCLDKVEKAKEDLINKVNDAAKNNAQKLKDLLMAIAELGIALGELIITCLAFPIRFGLAAASIIGTCPIGPTVQPTQLVMTLKQFKEVGDDMGTKYSKCQAAWNKLGADELIEGMKSNPVIAMIPGFAATLTPVTTAFELVNTVLTSTKPMITMVGGGVCSVSGGISAASILGLPTPIRTLAADDEWPGPFSIEGEDEEGEEVTMEAPDIEFDADPEACFNFSQKKDTIGITAENCNNFKAIQKDKGISCDNCTKYKPFHKQITVRVRENTNEIFGSNDLWLKASEFTALPGSLKYKIDNQVGWDLDTGWDKENHYIWVDLKNSKGQVLGVKANGHTASFEFNGTVLDSVEKVEIWDYESLSNNLQQEVKNLMGWYKDELVEWDTFWGTDVEREKILYKHEEIPETDRINGNTYSVFHFLDDLPTWWINVDLLTTKLDFLTEYADATTQNYLTLDWSQKHEDKKHANVITAKFKYNEAVVNPVTSDAISTMSKGLDDITSTLSGINGKNKKNS